jgi:hypothetical protein
MKKEYENKAAGRGQESYDSQPGQGPVARSCDRGNQPCGSIKRWEFLD